MTAERIRRNPKDGVTPGRGITGQREQGRTSFRAPRTVTALLANVSTVSNAGSSRWSSEGFVYECDPSRFEGRVIPEIASRMQGDGWITDVRSQLYESEEHRFLEPDELQETLGRDEWNDFGVEPEHGFHVFERGAPELVFQRVAIKEKAAFVHTWTPDNSQITKAFFWKEDEPVVVSDALGHVEQRQLAREAVRDALIEEFGKPKARRSSRKGAGEVDAAKSAVPSDKALREQAALEGPMLSLRGRPSIHYASLRPLFDTPSPRKFSVSALDLPPNFDVARWAGEVGAILSAVNIDWLSLRIPAHPGFQAALELAGYSVKSHAKGVLELETHLYMKDHPRVQVTFGEGKLHVDSHALKNLLQGSRILRWNIVLNDGLAAVLPEVLEFAKAVRFKQVQLAVRPDDVFVAQIEALGFIAVGPAGTSAAEKNATLFVFTPA